MRDKLKLQNFTINKIQKTQNEGRKEEIGKKSNNKPGKMTLKFRPTKLRYIRMAQAHQRDLKKSDSILSSTKNSSNIQHVR